MVDKKRLTAPCGLDCFNCELFVTNLTEKLSMIIHKKLGIPVDEIPCKGCWEQNGNHFHLPKQGCATLDCVKDKGVTLCSECDQFPCALLAPTANGAEKYPHNMKIYNLCLIKQKGLEHWIGEAADIRKKYFTNAFVVGKGQAENKR